jgi:hypothetical protein
MDYKVSVHGVIFQKTVTFIFASVGNLTLTFGVNYEVLCFVMVLYTL